MKSCRDGHISILDLILDGPTIEKEMRKVVGFFLIGKNTFNKKFFPFLCSFSLPIVFPFTEEICQEIQGENWDYHWIYSHYYFIIIFSKWGVYIWETKVTKNKIDLVLQLFTEFRLQIMEEIEKKHGGKMNLWSESYEWVW